MQPQKTSLIDILTTMTNLHLYLGVGVIYTDNSLKFKVSNTLSIIFTILHTILLILVTVTTPSEIYLNENLLLLFGFIITHIAYMLSEIICLVYLCKENELSISLNKLVEIDSILNPSGSSRNYLKSKLLYVCSFATRAMVQAVYYYGSPIFSAGTGFIIFYFAVALLPCGLQPILIFHIIKCSFSDINRFFNGIIHKEDVVHIREIHRKLCSVSRRIEVYLGFKTVVAFANEFNYIFFITFSFATDTSLQVGWKVLVILMVIATFNILELFGLTKSCRDCIREVSGLY